MFVAILARSKASVLVVLLAGTGCNYPLNLPKEFQEEGLNVHVEGLLIRHYQVLLLPPVEIVSITALPPQ